MKAVLMNEFGGTEVLEIGEHPDPIMEKGDLLVRVKAAALNRADLLQRRGYYPPPIRASDILGLEMAGEVAAVGANVSGWAAGDLVCALLPGGGYAEYVVIPESMAMKIPKGLDEVQAASIPEAFLTAYMNLYWLGRLTSGQRILVHAGASGVGTAAIQLIREAGATALATAGSQEKLARCKALGADAVWNYHDGSFAPFVADQTSGQGVDIILDFIGAPYFKDNIKSLAVDGKLIVVGTMGGGKVDDVNLNDILRRRLQILGTALRNQALPNKIRLTREFADYAMPLFAAGRLHPVIDRVYDWKDVRAAHDYMESNANIGKIVLKV